MKNTTTFITAIVTSLTAMNTLATESKNEKLQAEHDMLASHLTPEALEVAKVFTESTVEEWSDKLAYQTIVLALKANEHDVTAEYVRKVWTKYRAQLKLAAAKALEAQVAEQYENEAGDKVFNEATQEAIAEEEATEEEATEEEATEEEAEA